jgi:hypothetical protein
MGRWDAVFDASAMYPEQMWISTALLRSVLVVHSPQWVTVKKEANALAD